MDNLSNNNEKSLPNLIKIDESQIEQHISSKIKQSVEDTLNAMLNEEADELCNAKRYERSADRVDTRAGHYTRKLTTRVGEVNLKVPKLRSLPFETQIIERYRRREASIEESLIEMYHAGVSVRRVEDITEALWGTRVSSSTVSYLNQKVYATIEKWRNEPITGQFPYVYLDGISLKRSWGGEVKNVSVLVAIGVNDTGHREILGVAEGCKEDKAGWTDFLRYLKERGLKGVRLMMTDRCVGLVDSIEEVYPDASWQRCVVHWYRNVFSKVPHGKRKTVATMLKAIHAQDTRDEAIRKGHYVVNRLRDMKLSAAAQVVEDGLLETLAYMSFPSEHWRKIRTNNPLERIMKEIRRRTRVVGSFPDGKSALMMSAARLRHISGTKWGSRRYMNMDHLREHDLEESLADSSVAS